MKEKTKLRLFTRRDVWCPTLLGGTLLASIFALPCVWWFAYGEAFLSITRRVPTRILVVEGWIGPDGLRAAKFEFERNHYDYLITSGGSVDPYEETTANWQKTEWTYADGAQKQLVRLGLPIDKVIPAPPRIVDRQRTYSSAVAVKEALATYHLQAKSINVFTYGAHARRSKLVYEKAYGPETEIGVIAWEPSYYASTQWWHSSERAIEFMIQTVGFFYEFLFNSGRRV